MSFSLNVTSTGNVGPATGGQIGQISLRGGSAASTATIRELGSGGTIITELAANISDTDSSSYSGEDGLHYSGQLHVTLTGAGASVNIEFL